MSGERPEPIRIKIHDFLDNNNYYTAVLSILALVTGAESVMAYSFGDSLIPAWFDDIVFYVFLTDFVARFAVFYAYKKRQGKTKYGSLFSIPFTVVDFLALLPDLVSLIFGTTQMDLKAIRALRALKLLRLTRLFTKNKAVFEGILNFFRYKLYGQGLVLGANLAVLLVFGSIFSFMHHEYSVYLGIDTSFKESINWGLEIFTSPYGDSYKNALGPLLKVTAFLGSTFGLFVYASIIGVLSNTYKGIFEIIDKGVGMASVKKGDFVIVGWNHMIPKLVEHITDANEQRAIVLGSFDKSEIRNRFESAHAASVYNNPKFEYINVDYSNADELDKLAIWEAERIVIVYDEDIGITQGDTINSANARDARILFTMKTIKNLFKGVKNVSSFPKIICEVFCKTNKALFSDYPDVEIISKESLFSNVFSQSVLQDDVLNVYKRLLKKEGKEIYLMDLKEDENVEGYFNYLTEFAERGYGLVGLYYRAKNETDDGIWGSDKFNEKRKTRIFLSPTQSEVCEAQSNCADSDKYDAKFIILAEDPQSMEELKMKYNKGEFSSINSKKVAA